MCKDNPVLCECMRYEQQCMRYVPFRQYFQYESNQNANGWMDVTLIAKVFF